MVMHESAKPGNSGDSAAQELLVASTRGGTGGLAEHRTVARVMSMLELVLASDPNGMRLADLSSAIEAPKSTVHGLAKGLVATGYFREVRGHYFIGPAISSLIAVGPTGLPSTFRHVLERLTQEWGETSMVATFVGDSVVYLDSVEPDTLIRAAPVLNKRLPLWPRASGRCFLAYMEPRRLDGYLRRFHPNADEADEIRTELVKIRESQVSINDGGLIAAHLAVASPVIHGGAAVTMAISVVGPRSRLNDRVDELAASVRAAAESLSRSGE